MNSYVNNLRILAAALALLLLFAGVAKGGEINTGYFGSVAIKGYDPVAYFTMRKAVKGSDNLTHVWLGATWQFSTDEHRQLFAASPVQYAPQYGGHCADGVAYGDMTVNIDPAAWRIIEGKLYLNYDQGSAAEFEELDGQMEKAQAKWPTVRAGLVSQ